MNPRLWLSGGKERETRGGGATGRIGERRGGGLRCSEGINRVSISHTNPILPGTIPSLPDKALEREKKNKKRSFSRD